MSCGPDPWVASFACVLILARSLSSLVQSCEKWMRPDDLFHRGLAPPLRWYDGDLDHPCREPMAMSTKGHMRLGAFFNPTGHHVASWRHPRAQADAGINFRHYVQITQTAERAKFDLVFLADNI